MNSRRPTAAERRARLGLGAVLPVAEAVEVIGGDRAAVRAWLHERGLVVQGPTGPRVWMCDVYDAMHPAEGATVADGTSSPAPLRAVPDAWCDLP